MYKPQSSDVLEGQWRFDGRDYYKVMGLNPNADEVTGHPIKLFAKTGSWFRREHEMKQDNIITSPGLIRQLELGLGVEPDLEDDIPL